jgi:quercetin dioxygenase-like cupin family protein
VTDEQNAELNDEQGAREPMESTPLAELGEELLGEARLSHSGRAASTLHGGRHHALRQTVIALTAGSSLSEHESPGEATLHVLRGRVRLSAGPDEWPGGPGELVVIPPARHALTADEDAVVLLTVAKDV